MTARPGGFQQPPQPVSLVSPVASDSLPVWGFLSVQPVPSDCPGQAHQEVDSQRSLGLGTGTPPGRDSRNASCVLRGRPCRVAWACSQGLEGVSLEPGVTCSRIRNLMPTVGYVMVKLKVTMPHTHHPTYPSTFLCGGPGHLYLQCLQREIHGVVLRLSETPCTVTSRLELESAAWGLYTRKWVLPQSSLLAPSQHTGLQTSGAGAVSLSTEDASVPRAEIPGLFPTGAWGSFVKQCTAAQVAPVTG